MVPRLMLPWTILSLALVFVFSTTAKTPTHKCTFQKRSENICGSVTFLLKDSSSLRRRTPWDFITLRGGSDEEEEDEYDDEDEESEDDEDDEGVSIDLSGALETASEIAQTTILPATKKALTVAVQTGTRFTLATFHALQRALRAAIEGEEVDENGEDEEAEISIVQKVLSTLQRMVKAAFTFPEEDTDSDVDDGSVDNDGLSPSAKKASTKEKPKTRHSGPTDFGAYLATSYGVEDPRTTEAPGTAVIGGTFSTAMKEARARARLLVVFIPAEKYKKSKTKESKEAMAIASILSEQVASAANQPARKGEETGSFLFWSAKLGSSEATQAMKRLKAKPKTSKGGKSPVLMVVYPAMTVDSGTGASKMVPKVLAQHHCSPPPKPDSMAAWLESLRKRYAKQYVAMQTVLKELQYFKERKEGYKSSQKSDKERKQQEKEEEERRLAEAQAEKERLEALEERRAQLLEDLPDEPTGGDVKKIALRFTDGRSGQRKFSSDQSLMDVFNWVDAMFEIERETVILTTMNGKQVLVWDDAKDKSLEDAGLGKNTGFRVTVQQEEGEEINEKEEEVES